MNTAQQGTGEPLKPHPKNKYQLKLDKKKLLAILPIIVLVLAGIGYYFFKFNGGQTDSKVPSQGINTKLPDAQFKNEQPTDKLAIYEQSGKAETDSTAANSISERLGFNQQENLQTRQIDEKLAAINKQINTPYLAPKQASNDGFKTTGGSDGGMSRDVAKLELLMKNMQNGKDEDPEMAQLSSMMDKLIAIQNPELAKQTLKTFPQLPDSLFRAIPAVIANNQKARQGSVVELRLLDTVSINGQVIPKGHSIFGLAVFSNQRLNLEIRNIRLGTSVIPVNLTVYDKRDAMVGINAPEALLTDAVNSGTTDMIGGFGMTGFDLTTQIAGAGIDAAKQLLTKKIGRIKQNLKAGYPLLLRDNTRKLK
ncbi:conjugative transposon protein TraM [Pedobacter helvus]|uniref:Conjugative transposon protein TraM n=1 Tax=Pedobacter helvus TaxID=2563444 RepID=A0ABW9JCK4_9SPHI|nr:conjugative transposon protein TraM [Pedobacter ureilyticus]